MIATCISIPHTNCHLCRRETTPLVKHIYKPQRAPVRRGRLPLFLPLLHHTNDAISRQATRKRDAKAARNKAEEAVPPINDHAMVVQVRGRDLVLLLAVVMSALFQHGRLIGPCVCSDAAISSSPPLSIRMCVRCLRAAVVFFGPNVFMPLAQTFDAYCRCVLVYAWV